MAQSKHTGRTLVNHGYTRRLSASTQTIIARVFAVVTSVTLQTTAAAQWATELQSIDTLPMGATIGTIRPTGVSNEGSLVVGDVSWNLKDGNGSQIGAFRFTASGGLLLLSGRRASGVSGDGTIIVGSPYSGGATLACRWVAPFSLPIEVGSGQITAISTNGSCVAGFVGFFAARGETGLSSIGALPGGTVSRANAVSADGSVVVGSSQSTLYGGERAFSWSSPTGMLPLALPSDSGGSMANAVSANGVVIVGQVNSPELRAVRWLSAGRPETLPKPANFAGCAATGISANGDVIVGYGLLSDGRTRGLVWTANYGVRELAWILGVSGLNIEGWSFDEITAISGDGSAIVGSGQYYGQSRAFVVRGFQVLPDTDSDAIPDTFDNCPTIANPTQADCNSNGVGDVCELAAGAPDFNLDTIPDTCQCLADLFVDRQVNGADLGALLAFWGPVNPALPSADINRDGDVNGADLGYLLNAWGSCTN